MTNKYDNFLQNISVDNFTVSDQQNSIQGLFFHRTPKLKLIFGGNIWQIYSKRLLEGATLNELNQTQFNPHLFTEARLGENSRLSVSFQQLQQLPDTKLLIPLIDSSSFTSIWKGNPLLTFTTIQRAELMYSIYKHNGNAINFELKHEIFQNPLITQVEFSSLGINKIYFTQFGHSIKF